MATIGATFPTILDIVRREAPDGSIDPEIVESLTQLNPILEDIPWMEGNLPTGHRYTSRNSLPSLYWRKFNEGISPTKSTTKQVDETCGMLTGMSKVDRDEAELNGNGPAFRATEDAAFQQAFPNEVCRALFYESVATNPERVHGLTARFNVTSGNPAANQIIKGDASASGADQTSIWLIGWGLQTVCGIYPKGSKGGLQIKDMGLQLTRDNGGTKEFWAWVTDYRWKMGFMVKDSRYISRACNIDTSNWKEDKSAGAILPSIMRKMVTALFEVNTVKPVYYMNRATFDMFNAQLFASTVNFLEYVEMGGKRVPHFMGFPIRFIDALTSTESVVS